MPKKRRAGVQGPMPVNAYRVFGLAFVFLTLTGFAFQDVVEKARSLAARPHQAPADDDEEFLRSVGYDQWRTIRFDKDKALWAKEKLPFRIEFFHRGWLYARKVLIHTVDRHGEHPVLFSPDMFLYGKDGAPKQLPAQAEFAGFRVHYPLMTRKYHDEVAVFLGATYMRAVAKGQLYGSSARGLAVDTGLETGEEFPYFTEFWINRPGRRDTVLFIYALLESPSMTGAYEFGIRPGEETVFDVRVSLFLRKKVQKLGMAPLTGMYFYGENDRTASLDDFRSEVHDCDGVLIASRSGEWIWRPLVNPERLFINSFSEEYIKGFGLLQRDEDFDDYQDLEARFEKRPSIWITPQGNWGRGTVELVQIPTENETNDNIVCFWRPRDVPDQGKALNFAYRMIWYSSGRTGVLHPSLGHVTATRSMRLPDGGMRFVIDFRGREIETLRENQAPAAEVTVSAVYKLAGVQVIKNTVTGGWRLVVTVVPEKPEDIKKITPGSVPAVELLAYLKNDRYRLTETWSYAIEL